MKKFELGYNSWRKAQVSVRLDGRSYTAETDDLAVYSRNRQHLQKPSEPPVEPIITAPEPHMAITDEKATTTAASSPERVRKSPAHLKDYVCDKNSDLESFFAVIIVLSVPRLLIFLCRTHQLIFLAPN